MAGFRSRDAVGTLAQERRAYGRGDEQFGEGFLHEDQPSEGSIQGVRSRGHRFLGPGSEERQTGTGHIQDLRVPVPIKPIEQRGKPFLTSPDRYTISSNYPSFHLHPFPPNRTFVIFQIIKYVFT